MSVGKVSRGTIIRNLRVFPPPVFGAPSDVIYFPLVGFHSNIVSALEDLKSDESFVDVTLSCDGETIQVN